MAMRFSRRVRNALLDIAARPPPHRPSLPGRVEQHTLADGDGQLTAA